MSSACRTITVANGWRPTFVSTQSSNSASWRHNEVANSRTRDGSLRPMVFKWRSYASIAHSHFSWASRTFAAVGRIDVLIDSRSKELHRCFSTRRVSAYVNAAGAFVIDRPAVDRQRGLFDRFRQRRMGVAGAGDVFRAGAEVHRGGGFGDQVARLGAENVNAQHAVGFRVGEDFHFAVDFAERAGTAVGAEWEHAFAIGDFFGDQLVFRFADGADFRDR